MSIEQSLHEYLTGYAALTAVVGTHIFLGSIPQGTELPAICFYRYGGSPVYSMSGQNKLTKSVYRFDILVDKYEEANLVAAFDALKDAIGGYRGTMGSTYTTNVQRIMLTSVRDNFEPDSEARERFLEFDIDYITS